MNDEPYIIVCNPCSEQIIAIDVRLLNKNGFVPKVFRELMNDEYIPLVIYTHYGKIYKCPQCDTTSGVLAPQTPRNLNLFVHMKICSNKNKYPVEI